jgi:hypothetical protein
VFSNDNSKILFSVSNSNGNKDKLYQLNIDDLTIKLIIDFSSKENDTNFRKYVYGQNTQFLYTILEYNDVNSENNPNNQNNRELVVFDMPNNQWTTIDTSVYWFSALSTDKESTKIYYASSISDVIKLNYYDVNTAEIVELQDIRSGLLEINISDDNLKLAFGEPISGANGENYIFILDSDGSNFKEFVKGAYPILSKMGEKILFTGYEKRNN